MESRFPGRYWILGIHGPRRVRPVRAITWGHFARLGLITMGKQPQAETHIPHVTYARCIITAWSARQCNQRLWALCYRVLWLSQSSECACESYCGSLGRGLGDESQAPNWMTHLWAGISQSGSWMGRLPPKLARQRVIALQYGKHLQEDCFHLFQLLGNDPIYAV